jgi:hypothetical protein
LSGRPISPIASATLRRPGTSTKLNELESQWQEKARNELAEMMKAQRKYDKFQALPLIVLAKLK